MAVLPVLANTHSAYDPSPAAPSAATTAPSLLAGLPVGPGISAQPGLYCSGVFRPLVLSWVGGTAKCNYRLEPPPLPEGHGASLAYSCLFGVVRSVPLVVDTQPQQEAEGQGGPEQTHCKSPAAPVIMQCW